MRTMAVHVGVGLRLAVSVDRKKAKPRGCEKPKDRHDGERMRLTKNSARYEHVLAHELRSTIKRATARARPPFWPSLARSPPSLLALLPARSLAPPLPFHCRKQRSQVAAPLARSPPIWIRPCLAMLHITGKNHSGRSAAQLRLSNLLEFLFLFTFLPIHAPCLSRHHTPSYGIFLSLCAGCAGNPKLVGGSPTRAHHKQQKVHIIFLLLTLRISRCFDLIEPASRPP